MYMQAELERDADTLKKEVVDIRLLAQRDIVLDPEAEMLEVGQNLMSCHLSHHPSRQLSFDEHAASWHKQQEACSLYRTRV